MSIYIKGVEMPMGGRILIVFPSGRVLEVSADATQNIFRETQAVPVPPHGRLIEKSALLYKCYQHYEDFMYGKVDGETALLNIENEIKAAPTIIPAEEGET